ncbi:MAG TPA: PLP-dependent cysteine synthase family protein [Thermoplasmata archaeon]|nr:PLP-dependent cysteine synthase family protein [Thermoplasmata archaeon]
MLRPGGTIETIGETPLVPLRSIVPAGSARVLVKLESMNPTGSMKDRPALAMVRAAAADGRLPPGGTVVEYTGGSTGTSLAFVAGALGFGCHLVSSDAFSEEKRDHMRALGARLTLVRSDRQRITEGLIRSMISTSRRIARRSGHFWSDQLNNPDASRGYHPMGEEIWRDTGGTVDAFVQSVGTSHSLHGTAESLRRHRPDLLVCAVEPKESPILSEGRTGGHRIEGIGIGFVPPLWRRELVDEIASVTSHDAHAMARTLARREGLFGGASSGANVVAALRIAKRLGSGATVVTLQVDTGLKYLTTEVYGARARAPGDGYLPGAR